MTVTNGGTEPGWNAPLIVAQTPLSGLPVDVFTTIATAGVVTSATGAQLGQVGTTGGLSTVLSVGGTLTLGTTGTIDGSYGPNNAIVGRGTLVNDGLITAAGPKSAALFSLSILTIGAPGGGLDFRNDGTVSVAGSYSQHGVPAGAGAIVITAGIDPLSTGTFVIGHRGTLEVASDPNQGGTYDFAPSLDYLSIDDTPGGGVLIVDNPGTAFDEALTGLAPGSGTIVLRGIGPIGAALLDPTTHVLRLYADSTATEQIYTFTDVDRGPAQTAATPSGLIDLTSAFRGDTPSVACFAAGTRIATPGRDVAVEALLVGDLIETLGGECEPILWIGHRRIDLLRHPDPARARPVCIAAGAFGAGLPARALRLSGDHAVFVGGALVPIRCLINGTTIRIDTAADSIDYYHLELAAHRILRAEGLPAESWLDTGNRAMFDNAPRAGASVARTYAQGGCAPLVERGPVIAALRARLAREAASLGHAVRAELTLGVEQPGLCRVTLPPGVGCVRLVSPSANAAGDRRGLGALVIGIGLDGVALPLTGGGFEQGFHPAERHGDRLVRWTDGDAALAIEPAGIDRVLEIEVAATMIGVG